MEIASKCNEDDILVVLLSGGGSALLTLPCEGISLEDKVATTRILASHGAAIHELNTGLSTYLTLSCLITEISQETSLADKGAGLPENRNL